MEKLIYKIVVIQHLSNMIINDLKSVIVKLVTLLTLLCGQRNGEFPLLKLVDNIEL